MKVLIACEFSGTVRDAFIRHGHYAVSCDILPTDSPGPHLHGDVRAVLHYGWDLMIAHPPCTYLTNAANQLLNNPERLYKMYIAAEFFKTLLNAPIPRIAVENPVMAGKAKRYIGVKQNQVIHPWQFGHGETKPTCLWLKGLSNLQATNIVNGRHNKLNRLGQTKDRWKLRSKTYTGIADAMATQWGI
jgi:hypothetical protein